MKDSPFAFAGLLLLMRGSLHAVCRFSGRQSAVEKPVGKRPELHTSLCGHQIWTDGRPGLPSGSSPFIGTAAAIQKCDSLQTSWSIDRPSEPTLKARPPRLGIFGCKLQFRRRRYTSPPPPPPKKKERQKKANPQRKAFSLFWLENAERLPRLHFRSKWWFFFSLITRWGRSEWNEMEWNGWHGFYGFSMSSPKFKATKQSGKIESWGGKNGKNRRKKHRSCHWHPIKTTQAREDPIKTEVKPFKSDKRPIKTR